MVSLFRFGTWDDKTFSPCDVQKPKQASSSKFTSQRFTFIRFLVSTYCLDGTNCVIHLNTVLPVFGMIVRPAFCSCSANSKIIPSQPLCAITSTATGRYSSCIVMVELYGPCPTRQHMVSNIHVNDYKQTVS
jgi:hypothetical protein